MHALHLFQEIPDTELLWLLYGLIGLLIVVIIVGSLTNRGKDHPTPESEREIMTIPRRKTNRPSSRKRNGKKK
jgi:hypothetical protein